MNDGACDEPWYCADGTDCTDCLGTCTSGCTQVEITNYDSSAKKDDIYASMQEILIHMVMDGQDTRTLMKKFHLS